MTQHREPSAQSAALVGGSSEAAELTAKHWAVLDAVRQFSESNGYPPTVRELAGLLGVSSTSTVHARLATLERAGMLERDATKPRALRPRDGRAPAVAAVPAAELVDVEASVNVPLVGRVAAGEPLLADHHLEGYLPVPKLLTRKGESFLLKVTGESMIDAGILDGDYVVVRRQQAANDGEIVIALVDGEEATCKRLSHVDGRVVLLPENATMEPIVPDQCELLGVVTGVLRAL
jgi:repressor LexA